MGLEVHGNLTENGRRITAMNSTVLYSWKVHCNHCNEFFLAVSTVCCTSLLLLCCTVLYSTEKITAMNSTEHCILQRATLHSSEKYSVSMYCTPLKNKVFYCVALRCAKLTMHWSMQQNCFTVCAQCITLQVLVLSSLCPILLHHCIVRCALVIN